MPAQFPPPAATMAVPSPVAPEASGLVVTLAVVAVLALAGVATAVLLVAAGGEPPTPTVGRSTTTAPTVTVVERR